MLRSLFSGISGLRAHQQMMDVTGNNIANFGQGAAQTTGKSSDLMIQGDGFFVVKSGGESLFTRAGSFAFDANGSLTTPNGQVVQGWSAEDGTVNTAGAPGDIKLPIGIAFSPTVT